VRSLGKRRAYSQDAHRMSASVRTLKSDGKPDAWGS
jgi:hypothetical protein